MKERPILFNGEMVRAVLDGRKSQTRRVVKPQPEENMWKFGWDDVFAAVPEGSTIEGNTWTDGEGGDWLCPYGVPGDRLWVRETFGELRGVDDPGCQALKDGYFYRVDNSIHDSEIKWTPSIHMPRKACRILLEVTNVRVERLQDISEDDAQAEGCEPCVEGPVLCFKCGFTNLWDSINEKRNGGVHAWDKNPWVWVVEFKII